MKKEKYLIVYKKDNIILRAEHWFNFTINSIVDEFKNGWHDNDKLLYVIKNNKIIYSGTKI